MTGKIEENLEKIYKQQNSGLGKLVGIEFKEFKPELLTAEIRITKDHLQPHGIMHGGLSLVLAETLASVGARLNLTSEDLSIVGQEINANHLRPVKEGDLLRGEAKPFHVGRKSQIWEIKLFVADKLICISRCTIAIVNKY